MTTRQRWRRAARAWTVGTLVTAAAMGGFVAGVTPTASAIGTVAAGSAQSDVDAIELVHPDDVRGNLTLPAAGAEGTTLDWSSSDPAVVSDTGEVTRPAHRSAPVDVVLTVTGTLDGATATRSIPVSVQPLPAAADYEAYAFAYFAGESTDEGEKIYLGASRGNDPLDYDVLNDGRPVLSSQYGTRGLRDPFVIRSAEGDRFFLLATDLKAYPAVDFGEAQESGSKYLEVWESTDLVHWSDQRHVKVSSDLAGNTWAPEAFYDEEAGEYVVYWASALYPTSDVAGRDITTSYQRMMYATTRDFVTFSEPQVWVDVRRGTGRGTIDATVVRDGDTYYRFLKDEAVMTPRQERSTDLRATVSGSLPTTSSSPGWQLVKDQVGVGQPNPWGGTYTQGEGPTVFRDNEVADRWYMFIDQPSYHGGRGYLAFRTDDIAGGDWQSVPTADLPSSPRHGTVIPVTQAELDTLRAAHQPDLLIESVADAAVTTREGTAPALPATVAAELGDGSTGQVEVRWDDVAPASYAAPGTFTVSRHRRPRLGRPPGRHGDGDRRRRPRGRPGRRDGRRRRRLVGHRPGARHRHRDRRLRHRVGVRLRRRRTVGADRRGGGLGPRRRRRLAHRPGPRARHDRQRLGRRLAPGADRRERPGQPGDVRRRPYGDHPLGRRHLRAASHRLPRRRRCVDDLHRSVRGRDRQVGRLPRGGPRGQRRADQHAGAARRRGRPRRHLRRRVRRRRPPPTARRHPWSCGSPAPRAPRRGPSGWSAVTGWSPPGSWPPDGCA